MTPTWRRLLSAAAALLLLVSACRRESPPTDDRESEQAAEHDERVELPPKALDGINVKTAVVSSRPLADEIRATAEIKANEYRLAHVGPRIPGKAVEVRAVLGSRVSPGQTLALLDSLELGEKKSAFLQARTNIEVARRNYEREERLFKQQISSQKEYLEAKGEFERSDASFKAAREALRLVGLSNHEIDGIAWGGEGKEHPLSVFPLLAPFAGTIVEQHITIGELIEPNENPYTIADLTTVWAAVDVYEKDLARLHEGDEIRLTVNAYPDEDFHGRITYLSSLLDAATRTAQARLEIDNRDGRLRPGMFATATITVPPPTSATASLVIPREAIQQVRGKPVAFVEAQPGSYEVRALSLGREVGPDIEALGGLAAGERVVTEGGFYLKSTLLKDEMGDHD